MPTYPHANQIGPYLKKTGANTPFNSSNDIKLSLIMFHYPIQEWFLRQCSIISDQHLCSLCMIHYAWKFQLTLHVLKWSCFRFISKVSFNFAFRASWRFTLNVNYLRYQRGLFVVFWISSCFRKSQMTFQFLIFFEVYHTIFSKHFL